MSIPPPPLDAGDNSTGDNSTGDYIAGENGVDDYPADENGAGENTPGRFGMILGIAAIPLICCAMGVPVGAAAVVLGYYGLRRANAGTATNRQQALTGLICGSVAIVLGIVYLVIVITIGRYNVG